MVIDFTRPYILVLLPVVIAFILYTARKLGKMYKLRKNLIIICRSAVLILMLIAFAGLSIQWNAKTITTVFLIDASDSTQSSRNSEENFVKDALNKKTQKDNVGIISFGDNSLVENFISKDSSFSKVEGKVNSGYTNIENALTTAVSMLPQNTKKRIVLVTDGEENEGKALKIAPSLLDQKIDLKVYKLDKTAGNEVAVDNISVPETLNIGQEFSVVVNISSNVNAGAKLTLFSGNQKVAEEKVQVQKGSNRFVFKDTAESGGFKSYRVLIEPDSDTELKNNEASTFTTVKDKPRVLLIEDKKGEADEVEKMLKASNMDYTKLSAGGAPSTLQEMSAYKTIITCNVSAENLNSGFLNSLDSYVKDFGGGFIATGGENSFALGGYYQTNLEKVLPVNMEIKGKKEIPDMAMMLVIDKSGSMTEGSGGISKLEIAKEGAVRTLDSLRPNDEIGVITFDDTLYWVVKRQKAQNKDSIKNDIGTIRPGGGTSILPSLEEAYNSLKQSSAKIKHIILLTDGIAEQTGYDELLKNMNKDNITVSTVGVGDDADQNLLENIAKTAGGRYYFTNDISSIPTIFSKETFLAAKKYLNNRQFTPIISSSHPIISGVADSGLPSLLGYVGASSKDTAKVILKSDEDDPILTVWQYGLGKTAAWNSDINGKWSGNYIGWANNLKLWQNIINYTVSNYENDKVTMEVNTDGTKGTVTLTDKANKGEVETKANIITPDMKSKEITLYPSAPGVYSGSFDAKTPGIYMVKGTQQKNGETIDSAASGLAIQYSPEYKISPDSSSLDNLIKDSGGKYIKTAAEVFKGSPKDVSGKTDMTPYLLILALVLFMCDVALRRLNIPYKKIVVFVGSMKDKAGLAWKAHTEPKLQTAGENISTIEGLNKRKRNKEDQIKTNNNEMSLKESTAQASREKNNLKEDKAIKQDKTKVVSKEENKNRKDNDGNQENIKVQDKPLDTSQLLSRKKNKYK